VTNLAATPEQNPDSENTQNKHSAHGVRRNLNGTPTKPYAAKIPLFDITAEIWDGLQPAKEKGGHAARNAAAQQNAYRCFGAAIMSLYCAGKALEVDVRKRLTVAPCPGRDKTPRWTRQVYLRNLKREVQQGRIKREGPWLHIVYWGRVNPSQARLDAIRVAAQGYGAAKTAAHRRRRLAEAYAKKHPKQALFLVESGTLSSMQPGENVDLSRACAGVTYFSPTPGLPPAMASAEQDLLLSFPERASEHLPVHPQLAPAIRCDRLRPVQSPSPAAPSATSIEQRSNPTPVRSEVPAMQNPPEVPPMSDAELQAEYDAWEMQSTGELVMDTEPPAAGRPTPQGCEQQGPEPQADVRASAQGKAKADCTAPEAPTVADIEAISTKLVGQMTMSASVMTRRERYTAPHAPEPAGQDIAQADSPTLSSGSMEDYANAMIARIRATERGKNSNAEGFAWDARDAAKKAFPQPRDASTKKPSRTHAPMPPTRASIATPPERTGLRIVREEHYLTKEQITAAVPQGWEFDVVSVWDKNPAEFELNCAVESTIAKLKTGEVKKAGSYMCKVLDNLIKARLKGINIA